MDNTIDAKKEELVKELAGIGAQYGYSKSSRHSTTVPFIFGFKNKTAIIDLEKTAEQLEAAEGFLRELGAGGKKVILVSTKKEAKKAIESGAQSANLPYVTERWIGGTMTNFKEIKKRIERMKELLDKSAKGELDVYTKKERNVINKELNDLERHFGGIADLSKEPDAVLVIDPGKEKTAIREAAALKTPVVALASSDCDISGIAYPIVGNDSARTSIEYFVNRLIAAYREGLASAKEAKKEVSSSAQ